MYNVEAFKACIFSAFNKTAEIVVVPEIFSGILKQYFVILVFILHVLSRFSFVCLQSAEEK